MYRSRILHIKYVARSLIKKNEIKKGKFILIPLLCLLTILIPFFVLSKVDKLYLGIETFLVWLIIFYCSMRLCLLSVKGQKCLIKMTFWIFVYIFLGLAPLVQIAAKRFPWSGNYSAETIFTAFIMIFLGLLAFDFGGIIFKPL